HAELAQHRLGLVLVDVHVRGRTTKDERQISEVRGRIQPTGDRHMASALRPLSPVRYFPRFGAIFLQASTRVATASADLSNIGRSLPLSGISPMRSTPLAPITPGTPT